MEALSELLLQLVSLNPALAGVITVVGVLRLVIPLVTQAVRIIVGATPGQRDDELAEKVFSSLIWNGFLALLDWLASTDTKRLRK